MSQSNETDYLEWLRGPVRFGRCLLGPTIKSITRFTGPLYDKYYTLDFCKTVYQSASPKIVGLG